MLLALLGLASCGVKNDLVLPDGKPTPKGEPGSTALPMAAIE